jgi:hypothetical protein
VDLGFETIGNATVICHDRGPLLVTDPWLTGTAYFGSWVLSHEVPEEQLANARAAKYVWLSHGHPDHLSPESLETLRDKPILIGDHYGGRIADGLREEGYDVRVLETGVWTPLSDRVRVLCVPEYYQDAVLLVSMDGNLIVDANDASDRGGGDLLRREVASHDDSFLLCLTGYGDADMINFFDEDGRRVPPAAASKELIGPGVAQLCALYGIRNFMPFSAMHKYHRTDSAWANEYITGPEEHAIGFESETAVIHPPFCRYDLVRRSATRIDPRPTPDDLVSPEEFGDDWSEELEPGDLEKIERYFRRVEHLETFLGFVRFRVGGVEHTIDVSPDHDRGITFEVPRGSLMTCIDYRIFDDLLIGNYVKTTLHGSWASRGADALYPDFTPYVTKFGDNGGAYTEEDLRAYFAHYRDTGLLGPGPSPQTQAAFESIRRYL